MSKKQSSSDTFGQWVVGIFLLIFLFSWLGIPDKPNEINAFQIASLTFANGIFDGWADNIATSFFHSNPDAAKEAYRYAILLGEQQHATATAIFNLLGAFLSIGGVIAVIAARNAKSTKEAFSLAFWAEIAESVVFHAGYYTTVGVFAVSQIEVLITLVVAVAMGGIAMWARRKSI